MKNDGDSQPLKPEEKQWGKLVGRRRKLFPVLYLQIVLAIILAAVLLLLP